MFSVQLYTMKNWYLKSQYYLGPSEEDLEDEDYLEPVIDSNSVSGEFYHGSFVSENEDIFEDLSTEFSDWDAVWVTSDEYIAEEFGRKYLSTDNKSSDVPVVFLLRVSMKKVARIYTSEMWHEIRDFYDLETDMRESIPFYQAKGFDGWETSGGIDSNNYDDIAVFSGAGISVKSVKVLVGGKWSEYLPVDEAQELVKRVHRISELQSPS